MGSETIERRLRDGLRQIIIREFCSERVDDTGFPLPITDFDGDRDVIETRVEAAVQEVIIWAARQ